MKKELVLATNNKHKLMEIRNILKDYTILTLDDIGFKDEIIEDMPTFEENSLKKAKIVSKFSGKDTIADDSGLCVELLNNEPGVYSARYSKEQTDESNIKQVLKNLNGKESPAKYVCVISIVHSDGKRASFRGECKGKILTKKIGTQGFGYDPIFFVDSLNKTFAEISAEEKNSISHRREAIDKLVDYLGSL
ncbi:MULTISPECIES: RdgB/HAM1 family non-canonical purine NTP pyrophosphatase [unclassified Gemella]|uniref:RdgB/HAM1 family non-canonical purine NTP pyrophosphatase n=1 Tax=unclassified Gemella TaxID=2624949 RepID=UPI001C0420BC|nr:MULTISPECIES: RdgB/HAM1 family non-canonical purine NTP pyrophosphatase [unclassified Gemella]MBU0278537.1 RdgB/HAM1 family non-canonical purine NTP pyrophosphatase [Gemella sp. zg-1178]QWQ39428.1 RdgB/HAM1 family non-canonical purine NTP pyrophosphatase [Gemella sp. zg-570]